MSLVSSGCATWTWPKSFGSTPCTITTKPALPRQRISWHLVDVTVVSPVIRTFNLARTGRRLVGLPVRSCNLQHDQVADSTFFTNRDPAELTAEQVRWGPTRPEDLPVAPYVITKPKTEGKTPGFFVSDARGGRYLFKLDPAQAPELLSGAEAVTSKLLWALGYHVPSDDIVVMSPEELTVGPGVLVRQADGAARPFTEEKLRPIVQARLRQGRLRVLGSKILDGEILGPAPFKKFRDCAEMRALRIIYAWVNDIDTKDHNSLLVWDGRQTVGYLIDFGTALGADAGTAAPKHPCEGWLHVVDFQEASRKLLTLGLHRPACDAHTTPFSPAIGLFSPHVDPGRWKPYARNLAFDEMNDEDARWMARRMAKLARAHIEAAVSAGQYSDAADAAYLTDMLLQRRDTIVRHYLNEGDLER